MWSSFSNTQVAFLSSAHLTEEILVSKRNVKAAIDAKNSESKFERVRIKRLPRIEKNGTESDALILKK